MVCCVCVSVRGAGPSEGKGESREAGALGSPQHGPHLGGGPLRMSLWEPVAPFRVKQRYPLTRSSDSVEPLGSPVCDAGVARNSLAGALSDWSMLRC